MNKREASRLAQEKWGPTARAVTQSNVLDRNQRFGVAMVSPGGVHGNPTLVVLGYGDSYDSALEMAKDNPVAQEAEQQWTQAKKEWELFKDDPHAAVEKMKLSLKEAMENGREQANQRPEGVGDLGAGDQDREERKELPEVQGGSREG